MSKDRSGNCCSIFGYHQRGLQARLYSDRCSGRRILRRLSVSKSTSWNWNSGRCWGSRDQEDRELPGVYPRTCEHRTRPQRPHERPNQCWYVFPWHPRQAAPASWEAEIDARMRDQASVTLTGLLVKRRSTGCKQKFAPPTPIVYSRTPNVLSAVSPSIRNVPRLYYPLIFYWNVDCLVITAPER